MRLTIRLYLITLIPQERMLNRYVPQFLIVVT